MDTTPLGMQFAQFDTDHDGKITAQEAQELMKLLGKNVYQGTVNNVLAMMNYDQQSPTHFTFEQFREYFESYDSAPKHDIWKMKYELLQGIEEIKKPLKNQGEEGDTAAPGSQPNQHPNEPTQGHIQVTIGPINQNYDCLIDFNIEKENKPETKPFVKITFEQSSVERATKLENLIKGFHDGLVSMIKQMEPEYATFVEEFKVVTNVIDCRLNVFIKTERQDLIGVGILLSQALDKICESKSEVRLNFKQRFSIDINKFLEKDSNYTFYHAITQNAHSVLSWKAMHPKQTIKLLLKANKAFTELKYDPTDPYSIFLIGLLHVQALNCSFVFDNAEFEEAELESKNQILQALTEMQEGIKSCEEESPLKIRDLISAIDDKIQIDVSIGDWKVSLRVEIKDLTQVFLKSIVPEEE